jgi:molybdate transport system substrate-binding protein
MRLRLIAVFPVMLLSLLGEVKAAPGLGTHGLTVFAASSLTDAFKDIGTLWIAKGHKPITFSFASSSVLAQQIEHGAPAEIFASADEKWMDQLATERRVRPQTRSDVVGNTLVLVEPKASLKPVIVKTGMNFNALLGAAGRLAVGDPAHVPAGIYAEQALRNLGLWDTVQARLAPAENVRSALMLVTTGQAPAGIVYGTDARIAPSVGVAGTFPPDSHDPIRYPVAATTLGTSAEVTGFLAFLHTQPAQDVFAHYGFSAP